MPSRKQEELAFHDRRVKDQYALNEAAFEKKYANMKFYSVVRKSRSFISAWIGQNSREKVALDYCCGRGELSLEFAKHGAFVYGVDISEESINAARKRLADAGYAGRGRFRVMDAEDLQFEEDFFDAIVCSGVLHHLDCVKAYRQLSRVLKKDGKVICIEALGYNPVIQFYRRRTPNLRTTWEVDHILTMREVREARKYFGGVDIKFFHLFSIMAVPFRKTVLFEPVLAFLEGIDSVILKLPLIRLLAWQMIFVLSEPRG